MFISMIVGDKGDLIHISRTISRTQSRQMKVYIRIPEPRNLKKFSWWGLLTVTRWGLKPKYFLANAAK